MSEDQHVDERNHRDVVTEAIFPADDRKAVQAHREKSAGGPRLRVGTIERTALIRVEGAEILFEESAVQAVSEQLHRLVEEGHSRLLVNLAEVQHLSCALLGVMACLQRKLEPARGRIQLCGLSSLLRDMLRITGLDGVFDVYGDEAEALGLMHCTCQSGRSANRGAIPSRQTIRRGYVPLVVETRDGSS